MCGFSTWWPPLRWDIARHAGRVALSSGWRLHDGTSVSDVDAPPLLVHRAVVRPAQGDEILELGGPAVRPVNDVVPVNPQM